jgi:hypothetical protein
VSIPENVATGSDVASFRRAGDVEACENSQIYQTVFTWDFAKSAGSKADCGASIAGRTQSVRTLE